MRQFDIIIVGAGPAGMTAALEASKECERILLMDGADKIGKKILVTGNGKCNLTNEVQGPDYYRSDQPERVQQILGRFGYDQTLAYFHSLGILTRSKNGYIYPYNEQAAGVRESFESVLSHNDRIEIITGSHVDSVEYGKKGYVVRTDKEGYRAKALILCTGGLAGPKIGCHGSGYEFARYFGHQLINPYPSLTPLKSSAPFLKKASGVRNQAKICLQIDGKDTYEEKGELQWTDYGISGVAVFQLSRHAILAMENGQKVGLKIDFMPEWSEESLEESLRALMENNAFKSGSDFLAGFVPAKLSPIILREARIPEDKKTGHWKDEDFGALCHALKSFLLRINGYVGFEKAQVTRGGISFSELTDGLESVYNEGLFFAGELVDVDGACGGYNLQWAFSSGHVAGRAAAQFTKKIKGNNCSEQIRKG